MQIPPNILLFKTIFVLRSLFHKLLCELGAGRIIKVGETIPVVLTDMDAGIVSSDGWFSCGTVYAVIFTVIVVKLMCPDAAAPGQKIFTVLFQFDISEAHQASGIEAFFRQHSCHKEGMSFSVCQRRMQV